MITIFTPTYNRAYILPKLYESLCAQTSKNFEWIVVNDGSKDETLDLLEKWNRDGQLNMRYSTQINSGKHVAINNGVKMAKGDLFFIVDSDDYLTEDAIESIAREWAKVNENNDIAGICFRKINYSTGEVIGEPFPKKAQYATTFEIHYKWRIHGDKAEIFRTKLLRQNPFPEIDGEFFMTEAYIWNKIAGCKKLYCVNKGIYMCEYLKDGLTSNFMRLLKNNPKGYIKYYHSLYKYRIVWSHPIDIIKITIRLLQSYYFRLF